MLLIIHKYCCILLAGIPSRNPTLGSEEEKHQCFLNCCLNQGLGPLIYPATDLWGEKMVLTLMKRKSRFLETKVLPRSHSWSWQREGGTQAWLQGRGTFPHIMLPPQTSLGISDSQTGEHPNHPEVLLKTLIAGPHTHSFWFSRSGWYLRIYILSKSQETLMLPVLGPHFESLCCVHWIWDLW